MYHNQKYANIGENIACSYLSSIGYSILFRNYRIGKDEIDIVANKNIEIIFIEVKTRLNQSLGKAEDHISPKKYQLMKRAAQKFCLLNNIKEEFINIEIVAIDLQINNKMANIKHFINMS